MVGGAYFLNLASDSVGILGWNSLIHPEHESYQIEGVDKDWKRETQVRDFLPQPNRFLFYNLVRS